MSNETQMITWTVPMARRFKKAYQQAVREANGDSFTFDGHEFVVGYAKYLIEYLEMQFGETL